MFKQEKYVVFVFIILLSFLFSDRAFSITYDAEAFANVNEENSPTIDPQAVEDEYESNTYNQSCDDIEYEGRTLEQRITEEMKLRGEAYGGTLATNPACEEALIAKGFKDIGVIIGGFFAASIASTSTFGLSMVAYLGAVGLSLAEIDYMFGCTHAFVKDPVERYETGGIDEFGAEYSAGDYRMYNCADGCTGENTDVRVPMAGYGGKDVDIYGAVEDGGSLKKASYSNYIEVCHRKHLSGLFNFISEKGGTITLHPREDDFGFKPLKDLCDMKKKVGGELECALMKNGDKINIHNYDYKAEYVSDKICVFLTGLGGTEFYPKLSVGCHYRKPPPPTPVCPQSVPMKDADGVEMRDLNGDVIQWDNSACYGCAISPACYGLTNSYARAVIPIASVIVTCMEDTVNNIMIGGCVTKSGVVEKGFLANVRDKLKRAILAAMVLAIAFFSIKMMTGALQGQGDYMVLMFKLMFVMYFAAGSGMDKYYPALRDISIGLSDLVLQSGGNPTICNYAASNYMVPARKAGVVWTNDDQRLLDDLARSQTFDDLWRGSVMADNLDRNNAFDVAYGTSIHKAHRSEHIVDDDYAVEQVDTEHGESYRTYDRQTGETIDFNMHIRNGNSKRKVLEISREFLSKITFKNLSHIAPWDKLDCRIFFYLGTATGEGRGIGFIIISLMLGLIPLIVLFASQTVTLLLGMFYSIMIILTMIWAVHLYILAMIAFAILTLVSPIFLPMMLFQVTKPFFDGWLKELMAYTLYPVMIFAFLALFMSVFDGLYFEDLKFRETQNYLAGSDGYNGKMTHLFMLDTSIPGNNCVSKESWGVGKAPSHASTPYCLMYDWGFASKSVFGFQFNATKPGKSSGSVWKKLLTLSLMAFLFYNFFGLVGTIAAELTGSFRSNIAQGSMTPDQMAAKLASVAVKSATGGQDGGAADKAAGEGSKKKKDSD